MHAPTRARRAWLRSQTVWAVGAALALVAVACGGAAAPTATPTKAPAPAATATSAPAGQPTATAAVQASATPTRVVAPTATTQVSTSSRGQIVYAKPVDMGRSNTVQPIGSAGGPDTPFTSSLNAGMTAQTADGKLIPWLAKSWKYSNNGRTVEVTLRDDAVFQDGTPITVDDWVYRLDDLSMNAYKNVPGATKIVVPPVPQAVEKTGPNSLSVTYDIPNPQFITETVLTEGAGGLISVYPKAYIQKVGLDQFYKSPIGAGPYKLAKRTPADSLVLEAHEKFFNGPPPVKTIIVKIAPEDSTRVAMFRTAEADISESIAPQYLGDLEKLPGSRILTVRSGQEVVIHMQLQPDKIPGTDLPNPFRDIRVRQAVQYSVDKKAIVEKIAGRGGVAVKGPYSTFHLGADPDNITDYEYNPEKAKQLLKDANFPFDQQFPVYAYVASAPAPQAVESFANYLQAVGIKAQYRLVEVSALIRLWQSHTAYPMSFVRSWNVYREPIIGHYNSYMSTQGGTSFYADAAMDKLALDVATATDEATQLANAKKFFHYIQDQAYLVDLYAIVDNHGIGPKVNWVYPQGLPGRFDLITWR